MEIKKGLYKLKNGSLVLKKELLERLGGYVAAAFGLVVGLAWNDAIKSLIDYMFPLSRESLWIKFFYAWTLTLIFVIGTLVLVRLFRKKA